MYKVLTVHYSKAKVGPAGGPDRTFIVWHFPNAGVNDCGSIVWKLSPNGHVFQPSHHTPTSYEAWMFELNMQGIPYDEKEL